MFLDFLVSKKFLLSSSLGVVSLVVLSASGHKVGDLYSFEGSSSMKPAIEFLMSEYKKVDVNVDSNIQSVGSNVGLEKVLKGLIDFALVSHDVSDLAKEKYLKEWKDKKIKTITLAKEAILLLYKPPQGCDKNLEISRDTVEEIYGLFLGRSSNSPTVTGWSCGNPITVWVKNGGPSRSGTARAFIDNPLLKFEEESGKIVKVEIKAGENKKSLISELENADYDGIERIRQISESGALSWNSVKNNIVDGSLIYLPSSFVFTNWIEIKRLGLKVASFKGGTDQASNFSASLNKSNFADKIKENTYSWGRSLNLIYSTIGMTEKKKQLIKWIANNTGRLDSINLVPFIYRVKDSKESISDLGIQEIDIEQPDIETNSYGFSLFNPGNGGYK